MALPEGSYTLWCSIDSQNANYFGGSYSTKGTVIMSDFASLVVVNGDLSGLDMTLIKGHLVTGKIMIPEKDALASENISILMIFSLDSRPLYGESITIQAGTREAQYQRVIPEGNYTFSYSMDGQDTPYYTNGYYSTTGTVYMSGTASSVIVKNDVDGIDMTLSKKHIVTGKIGIPEDEITPIEDIVVTINASSSGKFGWSSATIQAGTREAQYQMVLPEGEYIIGYSVGNKDTQYLRGYYSTKGTVNMSVTASLVDVNGDLSDIDMTLVKGHLVTGKIMIPEQNELSTENISMVVYCSSDRETWYGETVIIQSGTREVQFKRVLQDGIYTFKYSLNNQDTPYYSEGYYSTAGTTNIPNSASWVVVNNDVSGIDMTLIKGHIVTGKIRIPETDEAPLYDITLFLFSRLKRVVPAAVVS